MVQREKEVLPMGYPFPIFIKASKTKVSIAKEIKEVTRLRLQFERSMTSRLMGVFKKVGAQAAKEYVQSGAISQSLVPLEADLEKVFRAHYRAVIESFGDRVYENRKQERFAQLLFSFYTMEGASKVRGVSSQTARLINRAVKLAEVEGLGVAQTAKRIREKTDGAIGRARASTIARTETHAAASYATHEATKELGLPEQRKRWVSTTDGRTRSHHAAANGQEVGIDDPFLIRYKGVEIKMQYPHDGSGGAANNINCRCLAVYFSDIDSIFDDIEEVQPTADPDAKPFLDLEDLMTVTGFSKQTLSLALNDKMSPLASRVADKLPKPAEIVGKKGAGVYRANAMVIESGIERSVMSHEYGHHVDYRIGAREFGSEPWSPKGLAVPWVADRQLMEVYRVNKSKKAEKLKALRASLFEVETKTVETSNGRTYTYDKLGDLKFAGADMLSDIIDSFVGGQFRHDYFAFGHSKAYWKRRGSAEKEAFANMFAITNSPEAIAWAEVNIPNLWAAFIAKMEDLDVNL
jgi:hypothetical protein